jgi:hypothetical protein
MDLHTSLAALAAALAADAAEHARHTARHQRNTGFARALAAVGEALL